MVTTGTGSAGMGFGSLGQGGACRPFLRGARAAARGGRGLRAEALIAFAGGREYLGPSRRKAA